MQCKSTAVQVHCSAAGCLQSSRASPLLRLPAIIAGEETRMKPNLLNSTQFCSALKLTANQLYCTVLYPTALHCTALHCTALRCTALHCTALHCTALHCTALNCSALHCTALQCNALYYTAFDCQRRYLIVSIVYRGWGRWSNPVVQDPSSHSL